MRKELWDIACDRWDEDDAKALYKVFSDYYDDEHWDEFCSLAFIGTDRDVDDFIFNEFIERYEVDESIEFYLDRDRIVSDWGIDYKREEVTTDEGYTRTVVCREFQIGGTMEDKIIETICKEEGTEYNYKFTVVGTFVGDEGETISQERILDVARMSDKSTAWEWLWNADFELEEE